MSFRQPTESPPASLVSVIIPVYNGSAYLTEAIESILAQAHQAFELILADDGSTDDSVDLIKAFAACDQRIRPLFLTHAGEGATLNAAVAVARGQWLALLKQDDVALPERLATQLRWLQQSGIQIGGTCAQHFGDKQGMLWFPAAQQTIRHECLFQIGLLDSTMMLSTEIAQGNPWQEGIISIDYEWLTRLVLRYRVGNLPAVLTKYRAHAAQTHVVQHISCREETMQNRRRYFFNLFPTASEAEYQILLRMVTQSPCITATQLAESGDWLIRLLDAEDRFQHEMMGKRWLALCERSAALGPACYQIYCQYASYFHHNGAMPTLALKGACALRLRPKTLPYRLFQRFNAQAQRFRS